MKTHTSNEVKLKYNQKTVEDAIVIQKIEEEKAKGFSTSEAIKRLILNEK